MSENAGEGTTGMGQRDRGLKLTFAEFPADVVLRRVGLE
jgi:hypothetical protein